MVDVLLFHHAQGLTPGVHAFADALRDEGHAVHTPDLYEGRVFATLDEGLTHAREVGFDELLRRGVEYAQGFSDDGVYAGFSLGGMPAQLLAQTRPCTGALLYHSSLPPSEFGHWPPAVPVQVHAMEQDPFFAEDVAAAHQIVEAADSGHLFLYPGEQHLFTDCSLPDYDASATELVLLRTLEMLRR